MSEAGDRTKVSRSISYDSPESATVFRIAWFAAASRPGVILTEHSEAESKIFKAKALFQVRVNDQKADLRIWVEEAQRSVEFTVWGSEDEAQLTAYLDEIVAEVKSAIEKFNTLDDSDKQRVKRALVAKACWDRLVHDILNKAPASSVYFQLAHGREMVIKATEGEEVHPLTLTTSAWLTNIESLPQDEPLPASTATELAKKSVDWKKETVALIKRYL